MTSQLFQTVAFSVIVSLLITFVAVPILHSPTGDVVSSSPPVKGSSFFILLFLVLIGAIFIAIAKVGSIERRGDEFDKNIQEVLQTSVPSVKRYIESSISSGWHPVQIKNELIKQGWPSNYVDQLVPIHGPKKPVKKRRYFGWF